MIRDDSPLVSVLLPSYNHEKYVASAIESVLNQTYKNIELIVLDDGSTDRSVEIISELNEKNKFTFIKQSNKGLIKSLEILGSKANGDYISLFSSDDLYHPEKIETLVTYLEDNPEFVMAYSKIDLIDKGGKVTNSITECYESGDIFFKLLSGDFFINGLTTLIRRSEYFSYKRDELYIDDFQFWLEVSRNSKIGFVDKVTAYYRIHNNHLSTNLIEMQKAEHETLMKYVDVDGFKIALDKWNLRWFRSFSLCYKKIAIKRFLPRVILSRQIFTLGFLKGLIKLLIPCGFFNNERAEK